MGLVESQDRSHDMERPITSRKPHDLKQAREREGGGGGRVKEGEKVNRLNDSKNSVTLCLFPQALDQ